MIPSVRATGTTDVAPASYVVENNSGTITAYHCNTGSTDYSGSSAATVIQQALNALTPNRTWKEKIVLKGNFILSNTSTGDPNIPPAVFTELWIPSYTILEIQGSLKLVLPASPQIHIGGSTQNPGPEMQMLYINHQTDIDIIGGVIDGNWTNQGQTLTYCNGINVNSSERVVVQSTRITNTRQWGLYVYEANRNKFFGVVTDNCGYDGVAVEGASNMAIDNEFYSLTSHDNGQANDSYALGNKNGFILEGNPGGGPLGTKIFGGDFYNNMDGIIMRRSDWTEMHGVDVYANRQDGIVIISSEGVGVIGGAVRLNGTDLHGTSGPATFRNGIRIDSDVGSPLSARTRIVGVAIKTNSEYGITERNGADYDLITSCIIDNNGLGPTSIGPSRPNPPPTGANTKIAHNIGVSTPNFV